MTLIDVFMVVVTFGVLCSLGIAAAMHSRDRGQLVRCIENLRNVNGGLLHFADDHSKRLPSPEGKGRDLWWWYKEQVKSYVNTAEQDHFACPKDRGYSDPKPFFKTARFDYGSYVFNGLTMPGVPTLAGWDLGSIAEPKRTLLAMEWTAHAPLSWHKSRTGTRNSPFYNDAESVVGFVDGHVVMTKIYYDGYTAAFLRDPIPGYSYRYTGR